ncbi:MAG: hypothetical protein GY839_10320 [candidate division Zixibacteria bacterium]|nr:hypothetical protein [candidate division Zixibacteria bacterium]
MRRDQNLSIKFLITYLLLMGFSICGYWIVQLSDGFLHQGMATIDSGTYIVWHLIAEFLAAVLSIIAAFMMLSRNPLGFRFGLAACGMLLYTGLNSIGWGLLQDPGLLILYIICAIGAFFGIFIILGRAEL